MDTSLRVATLLFLVRPGEILLAMKKRGFGMGRWNGVGGKIVDGESNLEAAIRETHEEISVTPQKLRQVASLDFYFPHQPSWNQRVVVFWCEEWSGEPKESEEMRPQWFKVDDIPYTEMWPDDPEWLPKVLAGEEIDASFTFGEGDVVLARRFTAKGETAKDL